MRGLCNRRKYRTSTGHTRARPVRRGYYVYREAPSGRPTFVGRLLLGRRRKRYRCRLLARSGVGMRRVTGIGGIFMSARDPKPLSDWDKKHLAIDVQDWAGAAFHSTRSEAPPPHRPTSPP